MSASKDSTGSSSKATSGRTNGDDLRRAVDWVLKDGILNEVKLHGNVSWTPVALVRLAVFWVWSAESSLVAAPPKRGHSTFFEGDHGAEAKLPGPRPTRWLQPTRRIRMASAD